MTIVGPLLMALLIVAPAYLSTMQNEKLRTIAVIDQTEVFGDTIINTSLLNNQKLDDKQITPEEVFQHRLTDSKYIHFDFLPENASIDSVKNIFES